MFDLHSSGKNKSTKVFGDFINTAEKNTIKSKLIRLVLSVIFPLMIIAIIILFFLYSELQKNIKVIVDTETSNIVNQYNLLKKGLAISVKLLAGTPEIVRDSDIGKINLIIKTLTVFKKETKIPFIAVHDTDGFSLGKGHKPEERFKNDSNENYVKIGLKTKANIPLIVTSNSEGYGIFSISPIIKQNVSDNFKLTGIATTGYIFNNEFASILKTTQGSEILFIKGKKILGSTIKNFVHTKLPNIDKYRKSSNILPIELNGSSYRSKLIFLNEKDDENSIALMIAININKELFSIRVTFFFVIFFLVLSLALSIYVSYKIAKKITEPVYNLVETSKLIGQGNYNIRAQIKTHDELEVLGNSFNFMIEKLQENINELDRKVEQSSTELKKAYDNIKEDLFLAKRIQSNFLKVNTKNFNSVELSIYYRPMMEIGGDIYDIFALNKEYYRIFLVDANGHGIKAALITMIIKSEYEKIKSFELSPETVLKILNGVMIKNYSSLKEYFTCLLIDIDINKGEIIYSSAGHPYQIMIRNNSIEILECGGKIMGTDEDNDFSFKKTTIKKGDKLVLFTDGLYSELLDENLKQIDDKNIIDFFSQFKKASIHNIIENLSQKIETMRGENLDDITLIGIKYL